MASNDPRYPLLVDTDALIAVANSPLWALLTEHLGLTTTNVCQQELKRHLSEHERARPRRKSALSPASRERNSACSTHR